MSMTAQTLPDDPDALKAMLLAERAQNERLRQIIKELQRHRFGRRAETLPEDQLLLGLEEVEQVAAAAEAEADAATPADRKARAQKRRTNRGALPAHLPRVETAVDIADGARSKPSTRWSTRGSLTSERIFRVSSASYTTPGGSTQPSVT